MELLQNVDQLVKTEFEVYMKGAITREITRTAVKVGVQVALGILSENVSDWRTQYALKASQVVAAGWMAATVGADVRSWRSLPKNVYVARTDKPASGVLSVSCGRVNIPVSVPPGGNSAVFVRIPTPKAAPSVRVVNLP